MIYVTLKHHIRKIPYLLASLIIALAFITGSFEAPLYPATADDGNVTLEEPVVIDNSESANITPEEPEIISDNESTDVTPEEPDGADEGESESITPEEPVNVDEGESENITPEGPANAWNESEGSINPPSSPIAMTMPTETVLFDDFETMDADNWHIPTWQGDGDGTFVGRTQFRCTQNSPLPQVINDIYGSRAIISVDTYNPTGQSFYGYDLISNQSFTPVQGLIVRVRAKLYFNQSGIVGGIFLYALKQGSNTLHDEIDFELLGNHPDKVWTNVYGNEPLGAGHSESYPYASGATTDYHTYEILWLPNQVSWSIDGNIIRTYTAQSLIPSGPMYLHLNMWVPDLDWTDAYSASLQWTDSPESNHTFSMNVDSVTVTQIMELTSPTITNSNGVTQLTFASARLNGDLTSSGGINPTVHIYWGDNDGGTNPENWDNDINLGTRSEGLFSKHITGLAPYTTYYYRCYAENVAGGNWAPETTSFVTYHSLNISVNGSGSTTPSAGLHSYPHNSLVDLTATPEAGSRFINWTGDTDTIANVNDATATIIVNGDYNINANFTNLTSIEITPDNLTVSTGDIQQFIATGIYSDTATIDLTDSVIWSSSDTGKAVFSSSNSNIGDFTVINNSTTVYCIDAEQDKIYKSNNAGISWNELVKPPFMDELQLIAAFPDDSGQIVVLGDDNKLAVYWPLSENWTDISNMGPLSPTVLYDIDVSPSVSFGCYIAAAGKSATGPGLYYLNWGAATPGWKNAATDSSWVTPDLGWDAFNAVAFSPSFESDYMAVTLSSKAAGGGDALLLHTLSFSMLKWEPFRDWQHPDDYPVIVDTASGNFTVNKASLAILPDYDGSDESLRILFAGYAGTDDTGETGGIFLILDTVKREMTTAPVAINSLATDGTNLFAGAYYTNLVYHSSNPLETKPALLSSVIGSSGLSKITVGYSGEEILAGSMGEGSYFAVSTNYGETFYPRSFIENSDTIQTLATGQVTITAQYGPLVDTTILTINDITKQPVLTMAVSGNGSVTPEVGQHKYDIDTTVYITATPSSGWKFAYWSGDIQGGNSSNSYVTMHNDKVVVATFEPSSSANPPSGGGGGGGGGGSGGGGGGANGKTITSLRGSVSSTGVAWANIQAISLDTKCTLDIAYGTKCLNANGYALATVTITQIAQPDAAQSGVTIVGTVYELGPAGATFDKPVTLTIKYSESSLPAGTPESSLTISIWNAESKTYKPVECHLDTGANKITASINHFSRYTILAAPRPAAFTLSGLTISPATVKPGDTVSISVTVSNTGDVSGNYTCYVSVNGVTKTSKTITIDAGGQTTVSFSITAEGQGTASVSVGSLSGTFNIISASPASFEIGALTISPPEVYIGSKATVSVTVTNTGETAGTYQVKLNVNGTTTETKEVSLSGGASQQVSFSVTGDVPGKKLIEINGLLGGFIVRGELPPPEQIPLPLKETTTTPTTPVESVSALPVEQTTTSGINWGLMGPIIGGGLLVIAGVLYLTLRRKRSSKPA